MITSSDRRARCTREDRVERRQDKARESEVNGAAVWVVSVTVVSHQGDKGEH